MLGAKSGCAGAPFGRAGAQFGRAGAQFGRAGAQCGRAEASFGRAGPQFGRAGTSFSAQNFIFSMVLHASNAALRKCSDPYKTLAGATKIKVFYISQASRTSSQTTSNRSRILPYEAFHQDRATNWSLELPSLILEGSGALLGGSWLAFERP